MTYIANVLATQSAHLLAYWPMNEASGAVAEDATNNNRDGAYTGVTLGETGIGDGNTCPFFDGTNDYNNIYSAGLSSVVSGDTGTAMIWCKVYNVGVWADASARRAIILKYDWSNYVTLHKESGGLGFNFRHQSPANENNVYYDVDNIAWFCAVLTWDRGADAIKAYINGSQYGATQTGMAAWAGAIGDAGIGARVTFPTDPWYGWLAHAAVWDIALTSTEVAALATIPAGNPWYAWQQM